MTKMATPLERLSRWKARFCGARNALGKQLDTLSEGEIDWTPDYGIATSREHLWSIAENERWLVSRLVRGVISPAQAAIDPNTLEIAEIHEVLGICHRSLMQWFDSIATQLDTIDSEEELDREVASIDDLLFHHMELKAAHTAAIACLSQLIDPSRTSVLGI